MGILGENYTIIFNQIAGSLERVREIGLFSVINRNIFSDVFADIAVTSGGSQFDGSVLSVHNAACEAVDFGTSQDGSPVFGITGQDGFKSRGSLWRVCIENRRVCIENRRVCIENRRVCIENRRV